jgi:hypothetical protein
MSSDLTNNQDDRSAASFDVLRQFTRRREMRQPVEQCDLCSAAIPPDHRHLLDLSGRTLLCACTPCSILFSDPGAGQGKYRLVPSRFLKLADFQMTDEQWEELMIPVNMVYLFHNSAAQRVMVFYPSPAGAMESTLTLHGWDALVDGNPILKSLEPDVEALFINRVKGRDGQRYREHYIVPIDVCYELVGLIRLKWRGLSGGEEVWKAIEDFFERLRSRSMSVESSATGDTWPAKDSGWRVGGCQT